MVDESPFLVLGAQISNLEKSLVLKDDPFHVGTGNQVNTWTEFLQLETAKPLAYYDHHPFFGRWPAITRNSYGKGSLTYEGTLVADALQAAIVQDTLRQSGIEADGVAAESTIRIKNGTNYKGQRIHYFLNYSSLPVSIDYRYGTARSLLSQQ